MKDFDFTDYFINEALRKRPYLTKEMCVRVVEAPKKMEPQSKKRFRFWAKVEELGDRYIRVVTLENKKTIHNAFLDRGFKE